MESVNKLIVNYKCQIDYLNKINQVVHKSKKAGEIEQVIEGLRLSQNLIENIMELNTERKDIEDEIVIKYDLPDFDLIKLSLKIDNEISHDLMNTLDQLKEVTEVVIEGKSEEIDRIQSTKNHMKSKYQETVKGQQAFKGYKRRNYESYFINRVSE
jgi:hypothetical protein